MVAPPKKLLLTWILLLFTISVAVGVETSDYLYHDMNSSIIYDYEPIEAQGDLPDIIFDPDQGPRVIEFYAPWCPHCRHFRQHYVDFAEQVTSLLKENNYLGPPVQFCAISCATAID